MTAVVLVHQGLDVTLPLAPADGGVAQRGGSRVVVVNPADRCALEWALRLARQVTALALGPPEWMEALRLALARGARRAVRVGEAGLDGLDAGATARLLARAVERLQPRLVLAGERGLAGATGLVPALVAAQLGWPCLEGALAVTAEGDGRVVVARRAERGAREELEATLPAVVTVSAGSVEPRYVSVRSRQAAADRPVETWTPTDLGLAAEAVRSWSRTEVVAVDWPRPRARRSAAPPRAASAAERLRQLLAQAGGAASGGARPTAEAPGQSAAGAGSSAPGADRRLLRGDPAQLAREILAFLAARGLLP